MNKRKPGDNIRIVVRDLAPPEEDLLRVMRFRSLQIGQTLRHPAALVRIDGDLRLHRLVEREEGAARRHRLGAKLGEMPWPET